MVLEQCEDRCYRIGQEKPVDVTYNDVPYTIDYCMRFINESKAANASVVLSDSIALSNGDIAYRDLSGFLGNAIRLLRSARHGNAEGRQDMKTDVKSVDDLLRDAGWSHEPQNDVDDDISSSDDDSDIDLDKKMKPSRVFSSRSSLTKANAAEDDLSSSSDDVSSSSNDDSSSSDDGSSSSGDDIDLDKKMKPSRVSSSQLSLRKAKKERASPTSVTSDARFLGHGVAKSVPGEQVKEIWSCPSCTHTNYDAPDTTAICSHCNYHRVVVQREGNREVIVID